MSSPEASIGDLTPFAAPVPGRARRRSRELTPLSREHHQALKWAMDLKRAHQDSAAAIWKGFLEFWEHAGNPHFSEEETELLPRYACVADPRHPAVIRTLLEHVLIRGLILAIRELPNPLAPDLNELGTWIELHVRHEERVLFPLIEDATGMTPA